MSSIVERIRNEPALVIGLITAIIAVAVTLGVDVSDDAKAAIIGLTTAVLALVTRSQVYPASSVEDAP